MWNILLALVGIALWIGLLFMVASLAKESIEEWMNSHELASLGFSILFSAATLLILIGLPYLVFNPKPGQSSRPCIRTERTYIYDPALKIPREAEYCAQYGEWVDREGNR